MDERLRRELSSKDYDDYKESEKNYAEWVEKRGQWVQNNYEHLNQDTDKSCLREKLEKMYVDKFKNHACFSLSHERDFDGFFNSLKK